MDSDSLQPEPLLPLICHSLIMIPNDGNNIWQQPPEIGIIE